MSATRFRSSGDLGADRRYLWGEGALAEGDAAGAADLFRQSAEAAPRWPVAWFALGKTLLAIGDAEGARSAFETCLTLDPEDSLGASLFLARQAGGASAMPHRYVADLFDDYADRFDAHLTGSLQYTGPERLRAALISACAARSREAVFDTALDLGCGTGLMARALDGLAGLIDGVDLSGRMLERAKAGGLYRRLELAEAQAFLESSGNPYDLIVAADVLVYVGALPPLLQAARARLTPGGILAFTLQRFEGAGYALGGDMRFSHSESYVRQALAEARLLPALLFETSTRQDAGRDVPGLVIVATSQ